MGTAGGMMAARPWRHPDQHGPDAWARTWDEFYDGDGDGTPVMSGHPNGTLVTEVAGLAPGTALDVGCGEGADAIWLAQRGWQVTAVDPSRVALDRAAAAARAAGLEVDWVHAGLLEMPDGTGTHDLVSAQYPVLARTDDDAAITALLDAVAPGGTLLFVHHALDQLHADASDDAEQPDVAEQARHGDHGLGGDHEHAAGHAGAHDHADADGPSFDPDDYVQPPDVAAHLDGRWEVEVDETRPRPGPLPAEARHVDDVVLRARRESSPPASRSTRSWCEPT